MSSSMFRVNFVCAGLFVVLITLLPSIWAHLDDRSREADLIDVKSSNNLDTLRASNVLKSYLKELDRYVAIAGRPR